MDQRAQLTQECFTQTLPAHYMGFSGWIVIFLKPHLHALPHLHKSTQSFINSISACKFPESSIFVKLDISNFYMDSIHDECIEAVTSLALNDAQKQTLSSLVGFLLQIKFVSFAGSLYKCLRGYGMGKKHSSAISSWTFYHTVERPLIDDTRYR